MEADATDISIVIVTHNSGAILADCLQALAASRTDTPAELIVVDNASTDSPEPLVRKYLPEARYLQSDRNIGFAAGCNLGAGAASGSFLLFLNPDVTVDPEAVSELWRACRTLDKPGLCGGRLRFADGRFQPTCRQFPSVRNLLFSRGSTLGGLLARVGLASEMAYTLPDSEEVMRVPATAATMAMIHRTTWERMNGFDPRFFLYVEDTDLCYRLDLTGFRNYFVPAAGGVHRWGTGSPTGRVSKLYRHHLSMWRYFLKHHANGMSLVVLPALLLANFVIAVLFEKRGN